MACLDDETFAALVEGRLAEPSIAEVTAHLDECAACRRTVAEVARSLEPPGGANDPDAPLRDGDIVGRYVIGSCLGAGAMGVVYAARDPDLGRTVALKILRTDVLAVRAGGGRDRLVREAQAMARLSHPNVIMVHDVGTAEGRVFLAMELVVGGTLTGWLERERRSWRDVVAVLRQAGDGLLAAHKAGLVHRDFKPDNVLVGAEGRVRITDFGLARGAGEPGPPVADGPERTLIDTRMTRSGSLVGTPAYMAPEQLRGAEADARSDTFSFSVTLYEALYGRRPFVGSTPEELAAAIAREEVAQAPPDSGVPPWLRRVVLAGLRPLPRDRPASLAIMLDAIDAGLSRGARRRRVVAGALGLVVVALIASVAGLRGAPARPSAVVAGPMPFLDLPGPATANVEAREAYDRGVRRIHDGDGSGSSDLERAADLDPTLGVAYLRIAVNDFIDYPVEARANLAAAVVRRQTLSERDQLLLRAAQIWMQSQPADHEGYARALLAALAKYPLDAELAYEAAVAAAELGRDVDALSLLERALAVDPSFAPAHRLKIETLAFGGDRVAASAAVDECLRLAPSAPTCLLERTLLAAEDGDCARVGADAETLMARNPSDDAPYWPLALASYAEGKPIEVVRELFRQRVARLPSAHRDRFELQHLFTLDVLTGDFEAATARAAVLEASAVDDASRRLHARAALWRSSAALESGDPAEAARAALAFLRRKEAWVDDPRSDDFALLRDPTPTLLVTAREGGGLGSAEFETARREWVDGWEARVAPRWRPFVWLHGYAEASRTSDDAARALSALGRYGALPGFTPHFLADAGVGGMYFLAGRVLEAIPHLRRAARSCLAVESPFQHTRATFLLGQALATSGDRDGACAAYGVVLARWGHAKPRSVTGDAARRLSQELGCSLAPPGAAKPLP